MTIKLSSGGRRQSVGKVSRGAAAFAAAWVGVVSAALVTAGSVAADSLVDHLSGALESVEVSDLYVFPGEPPTTKVAGGVVLIRDFRNRVVTATLSTSALTPGHAYSLLWAVFNNPWFCSYPCNVNDLEALGGDPRTDVSVFWAGGLLADENGYGSATIRLVPGPTSREPFAGSNSSGLRQTRFGWAEIRVGVRDHGPATTGMIAKQIGTSNESCLNEPPKDPCFNAFISFHPPLAE